MIQEVYITCQNTMYMYNMHVGVGCIYMYTYTCM